jgi:hypothetical protein
MGMGSTIPGSLAAPRYAAGVFCVFKPSGRLRLICDRRARNALEQPIASVELPSAAQFTRILLPSSHILKLSGRDLEYFYFVLGVDEERYSKQDWGPRVPLSWFADISDEAFDDAKNFENWWDSDLNAMSGRGSSSCIPPGHYVQPVSTVILMGDLNAVLGAQTAHENLLQGAGLMDKGAWLGMKRKLLRGAVSLQAAGGAGAGSSEELFFGVYITTSRRWCSLHGGI